MKLLPMLLVNVLVAGGAVLVYDQVRGDAPSPDAAIEDASPTELEARIAALESAKPVELRTDGAASSMLRRIEALEARLAELGARKPAPPSGETVGDPRVPPSGETVARANPEEPSPEEIERFRELQKAARAKDKHAKLNARMNAMLDKAGVRLSAQQRAKVLAAQQAFGSRFNEIWGEAKSNATAGGADVEWDVVIRETTETIQREFSTQLESFLPQADAEAVSSALYPSRGK